MYRELREIAHRNMNKDFVPSDVSSENSSLLILVNVLSQAAVPPADKSWMRLNNGHSEGKYAIFTLTVVNIL